MSNREVRPPDFEDLGLVHNLIEQCLELHLSKRDAVNLIFREANIEPAFTELVWEQLEQDNQEFFEAYNVRLALRQQIGVFNGLLRQQETLMQQITNGVAPSPGSNGSHISGNGSHLSGNGSHMSGNGYYMPENGSHRAVNGSQRPANGSYRPANGSHQPANGSHCPENGSHLPANGSHRPANGSDRPANGSNMQHFLQNGGYYSTDEAGPSTRPRNLHPAMSSEIPSSFNNGMSMLQMPTPVDFLRNTHRIQNSDSTGVIQGLNEEIIISNSGYPDPESIFHTNGNVVGTHATMEGAPFSFTVASSQNESLLAINGSSFGHFGQIPRDFSFPDFSTAYPNVPVNHANPGFATDDADNLLVSQNDVEIPEDINGGVSESYNSNEDLRND